jgi:hypothetical protein
VPGCSVSIDPGYPKFQRQDPGNGAYLAYVDSGIIIPANILGAQGLVVGDVVFVYVRLTSGTPTSIVVPYNPIQLR